MTKKRIVTLIVVLTLLFTGFTNFLILLPYPSWIATANPGDIDETWHNESTLSVTVKGPKPWIRWYDFQDVGGTSKLNTQVDVDNTYKFCINITQNSTWLDIDYINITSWYDNNDDTSSYNDTTGGNLNMFLQYKNNSDTGDTAQYNMLWPDDEVNFTAANCVEEVHNATTHNITIEFEPRYQVRHAPGDGSWSTTSNTTDDPYSWNFRIQVDTHSGKTSEKTDEYGIYKYAEIVSAGSPTMDGYPLTKAVADPINVTSRSNENFTLSVEINNTLELEGEFSGQFTIPETAVGAAGGDLSESNFDGTSPLYLYGGASSYKDHLVNTFENETEVTYHCDIPETFPGTYTSQVYYHLDLE